MPFCVFLCIIDESDVVNRFEFYPRITFGMIVLNGEPFLKYNLRALYPFAYQIIVVEGACLAAASLSTPDGHSTDGTCNTLKRFKKEEDPENKLVIVTAEDEGDPNGFWNEKDEMSQAYARRATGDWLWQVDYDEFYLQKDMRRISDMLVSDPDITAVSFPYKQFWGGFDYQETGPWFLYDFPCIHRLFRWKKGYQYVAHRPPTVLDEQGRDLHHLKWISHKKMQRMGIHLLHYSYVLPKQARQKVGYYSNVQWSAVFQNNERWLKDSYLTLKDPLFIGEAGRPHFQWLERYEGSHPTQIEMLQQDLNAGHIQEPLRPVDDIERLLSSFRYTLERRMLRIYLFILYHAKPFKRYLRRFLGILFRPLKRTIYKART